MNVLSSVFIAPRPRPSERRAVAGFARRGSLREAARRRRLIDAGDDAAARAAVRATTPSVSANEREVAADADASRPGWIARADLAHEDRAGAYTLLPRRPSCRAAASGCRARCASCPDHFLCAMALALDRVDADLGEVLPVACLRAVVLAPLHLEDRGSSGRGRCAMIVRPPSRPRRGGLPTRARASPPTSSTSRSSMRSPTAPAELLDAHGLARLDARYCLPPRADRRRTSRSSLLRSRGSIGVSPSPSTGNAGSRGRPRRLRARLLGDRARARPPRSRPLASAARQDCLRGAPPCAAAAARRGRRRPLRRSVAALEPRRRGSTPAAPGRAPRISNCSWCEARPRPGSRSRARARPRRARRRARAPALRACSPRAG